MRDAVAMIDRLRALLAECAPYVRQAGAAMRGEHESADAEHRRWQDANALLARINPLVWVVDE